MKNEIETYIKNNIKDANCFFVFPTDIDAKQWLRKACTLDDVRTIGTSRFLAWDKFKEVVVTEPALHEKQMRIANSSGAQSTVKKPVTSEMRLLFTYDLIKRNKNAVDNHGKTDGNCLPLQSVIPLKYALEGRVFADSITAMLPHLEYWQQRKSDSENGNKNDAEDNDLLLIKTLYNDFLAQTNQIEISWLPPLITTLQHKYIIFYPSLIEDWLQYKNILQSIPQNIEIVDIKRRQYIGELSLYESSRAELRCTILNIQQKHLNENIAYEDIALSVPCLANIEPYILREFSLYDIPVHSHSGKALSDYGVGVFWKVVRECVESSWTFVSVKQLLLNNLLPWKDDKKNAALIDFGIQNNCVCGYYNGNKFVDVWENALFASKNTVLHNYYVELKRTLTNINSAKSFDDLRKYFFDFRINFFIEYEGNEDDESNAVLSRCIEELWNLISIEKKYSFLTPLDPYGFFLAILKKKQYVPKRAELGVNLFDYRIAAASPYKCHFVINANQSAASIVYRPLKFLSNEKRSNLNIVDTPASTDYFNAYLSMSNYYSVSSAVNSFSGWTIPHSAYVENTKNVLGLNDEYIAEKLWWKGAGKFPAKIYNTQKNGFANWKKVLDNAIKTPAVEARTQNKVHTEGVFVIPKSCTPDLIPSVTPQIIVGETKRVQGVLNPTAQIMGSKTHNSLKYISSDDHTSIAKMINPLYLEKVSEKASVEMGLQRSDGASLIKSSATDLKCFFTCEYKWLFLRVLKLEKLQMSANLLDDESKGLAFHFVLNKLFERIKETDKYFKKENIKTYIEWLPEFAHLYLTEKLDVPNVLIAPFLLPLTQSICKTLQRYLDTEIKLFNNYAVGVLEQNIVEILDFADFSCVLTGYIDRVSFDNEGNSLIIDYKTKTVPSIKSCIATNDENEGEEYKLSDFQIAVYVRLYEYMQKNLLHRGQNSGCPEHIEQDHIAQANTSNSTSIEEKLKVKRAGFVSIVDKKFQAIIDCDTDDKPREKFDDTLYTLNTYIKEYCEKVLSFNLSNKNVDIQTCKKCDYKIICRKTYNLNQCEFEMAGIDE
ncbi:MAG: hypothetical protein Ta2B_04980 [Termitinemataceae bacterium]|nr:MAG: hypothetical protein Ta2B_04980 [Termitinemataceae bacterium]